MLILFLINKLIKKIEIFKLFKYKIQFFYKINKNKYLYIYDHNIIIIIINNFKNKIRNIFF